MRSFFMYFGGKTNLAKYYGPPRRDVVVEPFAGSAGYSVYWSSPKTILIEKEQRVFNIWNWLINEATHDDIMDLDPMAENLEDLDYPEHVRNFIGFNFGMGDTTPRRKLTEL